MVVNCTRCRNEMDVKYGTDEWICNNCRIYFASTLSTDDLKGIIEQRETCAKNGE